MFFPSRALPFPFATVGPRSHLKVGPAAGRRTNARPKRLNGLFCLLDLIFNASMGQIRRLGGKFKTKHWRLANSLILNFIV